MNAFFTITLILTIFWNIQFCDVTIISSISKMEMLALSEKELLSVYLSFIRETEGRDDLENLRRYKDQIKAEDIYGTSDGFMENPINAFHFIKRMHDVWGRMISTLQCEDCLPSAQATVIDLNHRIQKIYHRQGENMRVSSEDLRYAAFAIVRLWQTYKLDLLTLMRGEILDEVTSPLTFDDVFYICRQLDNDGYLYKATIWLHELHKFMSLSQQSYKEADFVRVDRLLAAIYAKAGMPWKSVDILEKILNGKNDDSTKKIKRDLNYFVQKTKDIPISERNVTLTVDERDLKKVHYEALCRGEVRRGKKIRSKLRCIYRPTKIPYYQVKEEILNFKPRLSLFYDVITDKEIEYIKDLADKKLGGSTIQGNRPNGSNNFNIRISQTAWFADKDGMFFKMLTKRIELITGLCAKQAQIPFFAEHLQVLNYGVGGMYEPHDDYIGFPLHIAPHPPTNDPVLLNAGDREATWMFYLSDVKAGGATVFVDMNITVPPVKRAAAFWFDIKRNGDLDEQATHAGCPVLLGSKWVANKWIRQAGQMHARPCGRYPNTIDTPLYS